MVKVVGVAMAMVQGIPMMHSSRHNSSAGRGDAHTALGGVLLGGLAGVRGVGVGGQVARLHLFLLCGFVLLHVLGGGVAGGVLGGIVALHLLHVLGGGAAGGGLIAVRTAARAHGVLRS